MQTGSFKAPFSQAARAHLSFRDARSFAWQRFAVPFFRADAVFVLQIHVLFTLIHSLFFSLSLVCSSWWGTCEISAFSDAIFRCLTQRHGVQLIGIARPNLVITRLPRDRQNSLNCYTYIQSVHYILQPTKKKPPSLYWAKQTMPTIITIINRNVFSAADGSTQWVFLASFFVVLLWVNKILIN